MSRLTKNVRKALLWTTVVQYVLGLIFIGATIDSYHCFLWALIQIAATFPSFYVALFAIRNLTAKGAKSSIYLRYAFITFALAILEGFFARIFLTGLTQKMYAAFAALQISVTIESFLYFAAKSSKKSSVQQEQNLEEVTEPFMQPQQQQPQIVYVPIFVPQQNE